MDALVDTPPHLERAIAQLATLGVAANYVRDAGQEQLLNLRRGASHQTYRTALRSTASLSDLALAPPTAEPTIVVADHISPRTADVLRRAGLNYLDWSGNAFLEFGDVLIDVRGRPRPRQKASTIAPAPTRLRSGNLFSAGRSQVVCALLTWPQLLDSSTREIAEHAGVSLGLAHDALQQLRASGLADRSSAARLRLLDLWAAAFPSGLAHRLQLAEFNGDLERLITGTPERVFLSGESAVPELVRAISATLYVSDLTLQLIIANRWRTDGPLNITVRRAFWHTPPDVLEVDHAPWPLVYADLMSTADPRLRDAAEQWRSRHV